MKTYSGNVTSGNFSEKLLSQTWANTKLEGADYYNFANNLTIPADPCYVIGQKKTPPYSDTDKDKCVYKVGGGEALSLVNTLNDLFSGYGFDIVGTRPNWSSDIMPALWGLFFDWQYWSRDVANLKTVDTAMKSLADTLTDYIRSSNDVCAGASMAGVQHKDELYIHVEWAWLASIVAVLALCLIFFVITVISTWNEVLWKSSPLAYLFWRPYIHGEEVLPQDMLAVTGNLQDPSNSQPSATKLKRACSGIDASFGSSRLLRQKGVDAF